MTHKRADIELFVECLFNRYSHILLREEHITRTDKLKGYREYENGDEVKRELADMLERFVTKYESNDYVYDVRFHVSNKEGLSNYIDVTFNTPFGAKEWLKHMSIRASDHYQRKGREKKKVDEYIDLNGKSVADIEKELDRIINKRIRRLEREFNMPKAQNENVRRVDRMIIKEQSNDTNELYVFETAQILDEYENEIVERLLNEEDIADKFQNYSFNKRISVIKDMIIEDADADNEFFLYSKDDIDEMKHIYTDYKALSVSSLAFAIEREYRNYKRTEELKKEKGRFAILCTNRGMWGGASSYMKRNGEIIIFDNKGDASDYVDKLYKSGSRINNFTSYGIVDLDKE